MTTQSVRIPPTSSYLAGYVSKGSLGRYRLEPCNRHAAYPNKFVVCLFALKIENRTGETITIRLETLPKRQSTEPIDVVEAEVEDEETYDLGQAEDPRHYGVWIFVPKDATYVRVSAGGSPSALEPLGEFEVNTVGDIAKVQGDPPKFTARSGEHRRVYYQDGVVRLRNFTGTSYAVWTSADDDGDEAWVRYGRDLDAADGESQELELTVDGARRFALTHGDAPPSGGPRIFHMHDVDGRRVELVTGDNGKVMSAPYALNTLDGETVTVVNKTQDELVVWQEGNPPDDGSGLRLAYGDEAEFGGDSHDNPLPYQKGGNTFQSSIHWATTDDPKVIVRRYQVGQSPTREGDD